MMESGQSVEDADLHTYAHTYLFHGGTEVETVDVVGGTFIDLQVLNDHT